MSEGIIFLWDYVRNMGVFIIKVSKIIVIGILNKFSYIFFFVF